MYIHMQHFYEIPIKYRSFAYLKNFETLFMLDIIPIRITRASERNLQYLGTAYATVELAAFSDLHFRLSYRSRYKLRAIRTTQ